MDLYRFLRKLILKIDHYTFFKGFSKELQEVTVRCYVTVTVLVQHENALRRGRYRVAEPTAEAEAEEATAMATAQQGH